jgi:hypothetical protein
MISLLTGSYADASTRMGFESELSKCFRIFHIAINGYQGTRGRQCRAVDSISALHVVVQGFQERLLASTG